MPKNGLCLSSINSGSFVLRVNLGSFNEETRTIFSVILAKFDNAKIS
jgi:hypothetical protein